MIQALTFEACDPFDNVMYWTSHTSPKVTSLPFYGRVTSSSLSTVVSEYSETALMLFSSSTISRKASRVSKLSPLATAMMPIGRTFSSFLKSSLLAL